MLLTGWACLLLLFTGLYLYWQWAMHRGWRRLQAPPSLTARRPLPFISVVVAARNEMGHLPSLLQALSAQDYPPHRFEIIIVDDHSSDGSPAWVAARQRAGLRLLHLHDYLRGRRVVAHKKAALTYGIEQARGELIATTDADCRPAPTWLQRLAAAYCRGYEFISAPVIIEPAESLLTAFQALDLAAYMRLTGSAQAYGYPLLANGANLAFTRALFKRLGGYAGIDHLPSGDDVLLLQKAVAAAPAAITFLPDRAATVATRPLLSWWGLWQQRLRWASKTSAYSDQRLVALQALACGQSALILSGFALLPFWGLAPLLVATAAWSGKAMADFRALRAMARHFGQPGWMRYFAAVELLHTAYLPAVGLATLLGPRTHWKGRTYRPARQRFGSEPAAGSAALPAQHQQDDEQKENAEYDQGSIRHNSA